VSALGYYLEEEGVATVSLSLIRPQTEKVKPPRALWVPFELGRPFGPPDDADFQRRVVLAALRLLSRDDGPVIIEDFPDDDPRSRPDAEWRSPLAPVNIADISREAIASRLVDEVVQLRPLHERWRAARGRTTVGLSCVPISACADRIGSWLGGESPPVGPGELRFVVDDLKAYYLEAAASGRAKPSSRQLGDWLWNSTYAGRALQMLRDLCLANGHERLKYQALNTIVPGARVRSTG
jgi:hypothetical protein